MFTTKIFASLVLIAAAGLFDAECGRIDATAGTSGSAADTTPSSAERVHAAPDADTVRSAVAAALAARVRTDLGDPTVAVSLGQLALQRPNGAIIAADGTGHVLLGAGGQLPVRFEADWNPAAARIERIDYRVEQGAEAAAAPSPVRDRADGARLGSGLREAIASRVDAALREEFGDQPGRFELLDVERVESGRRRMVVSGTGLAHFDGEGAAFTRFSASLDKFDGRVVHVDYELLHDADADTLASR